jgi:deazaflavin-dependent oxidoreductase (nitroreductase family)
MNLFNRIVMALLRRGFPIGPMHLLTVTGRKSGQPRTTPIATFDYEGGRYVMQAWPKAAWVANARAAGSGLFGRRRMRRVALTEIPVEERRPMLRHVGRMAPKFLARTWVDNGLVASTDPESFAERASTIAVFRISDAAQDDRAAARSRSARRSTLPGPESGSSSSASTNSGHL